MSPHVKTITETPRALEPVTLDPFVAGLETPPRVEPPRPVPMPR